MNHAMVLPVALPLVVGALQILAGRAGLRVQRALSVAAALALVAAAGHLLALAAPGDIRVYELGGWAAPLGIVFVLDRLSALMLALAALVGLAALVYALRGWDRSGRYFHALFMFQMAGIDGAFLTGDMFNLFVFFEILLVASYCLMLHGGGTDRLRAGTIYVAMNLVGSALFLMTVGLLYGVTGTLNFAELGRSVAAMTDGEAAAARVAGVMLLVVFGLKAAVAPLHFWLPDGYAATAAPVGALFAIMTKVGAYCILRVFSVVYGPDAGGLAGMAQDWLLPAALVTLWTGMLGAVASRALRELVAFLLIASVGTLLIAFALATAEAIAAGLYYLAQSTLITAGLFLLLESVADQRGELQTRLKPGPRLHRPYLLGGAFLVGAVALVGLPPLSGFLGKTLILRSAGSTAVEGWIFASILGSALFGLVGAARAGSLVFWATGDAPPAAARPKARGLTPALALIGASVVLVIAARPVLDYARGAAAQVTAPADYRTAVLGPDTPEVRP